MQSAPFFITPIARACGAFLPLDSQLWLLVCVPSSRHKIEDRQKFLFSIVFFIHDDISLVFQMFRLLNTVRHLVFHHNVSRILPSQDNMKSRGILHRFHEAPPLMRPEEDTRTNRYIWKTRVLPQLRQIGRMKALHRQRLTHILRQELPMAVKTFQNKALLKQRFRHHVLEEFMDTRARKEHRKLWVRVMTSVRATRWERFDMSDIIDAMYDVFMRWALFVAILFYGMYCLYEYVYDRVRAVVVCMQKKIRLHAQKNTTRRQRRRSVYNTKSVCLKYGRSKTYTAKKTKRTGFGYHYKSFKGY